MPGGSVPNSLPKPHLTIRRAEQRADNHFRVIRLLEAKADICQRELAQQLGISLGRLNYCLRALADQGLVQMQNCSESANRLGYGYLLTPRGTAAKAQLARGFLKRQMAEYEALKAEIDTLRTELASSGNPPSKTPVTHRSGITPSSN